MPSRIVREGINSSSRVNRLSMGAELLYRRLMLVADDYGRFHGSAVTVRGACWPTCPEKVTERQVTNWLKECASGERPLIRIYEVDGARYLLIDGFGQQLRTKSKFPPPPEKPVEEVPTVCGQPDINLLSDCEQNDCSSRISEAKAHTEAGTPPVCAPVPIPFPPPRPPRAADLDGQTSTRFDEFWNRYPRKQRKDCAASQWVSVVTAENEGAVFACLERYLASDEVSRGVVANPDKWLYEQHRNTWQGDWPHTQNQPSQSPSMYRDVSDYLRTVGRQ